MPFWRATSSAARAYWVVPCARPQGVIAVGGKFVRSMELSMGLTEHDRSIPHDWSIHIVETC